MKTQHGSEFHIISAVNFVLLLMFWTFLARGGVAADTPVLAPLNPAFEEYLAKLQQEVVPLQPNEMPRGYIPSPVRLPAASGVVHMPGPRPLGETPSSYDLRIPGKVPPVRDQGDCGDCWIYASYASLESCLLPGETWDFSENHLKVTSGYDFSCCRGGNAKMATACLARWSDPVNQWDDPETLTNCTTLGGFARKHVQEVWFLPIRTNATDNDIIKQAVMNYGAVYTAFTITGQGANNPPHSDAYYNADTYAYYYSGSASVNHTVAIVGWDDNFSAANFSTPPPGDGAFILRNSWGADWGDGGYFYASYYDTWVGRDENALFVRPDPTYNFSRIYQYDPLGWTGFFGYYDLSTTAWGANIFTAVENEQLRAVSFYAAVANSPYEVHVYTNATSGPTSGTLASSVIGTNAFAGYHTIALPTVVNLTTNEQFSVVVKFSTPGFEFPVPVEYAIAGFSSSATAEPGQSYLSHYGTTWTDATSWKSNCNVCIKAFTSATDLDVIKTVRVNPVGIYTNFNYDITVRNLGPALATGVTATDPLPANVVFNWAKPSQGDVTTNQYGAITWNIGTLVSNATVNLSINVTPILPGTSTNVIIVSSIEPDICLSNNISSCVTFITSPWPVITTRSPLPVGAVGVEFNQTLTAGGGTEPYFWSVVSNSLPDGLTLIETNGLITGVPKMVTTNNFTVSVIDGGCQMAEKDFSLAIMTPFEAWQVQYFRCTDCPEATPYADPLGKGISNTNQFLLGLNPTNPASVFRITALTRQGNTNVITWSTAGVRTNVVQGAAGIGNGYNFSDISGGITISVVGDTITNHTDPSGTNAFYRIRLGP